MSKKQGERILSTLINSNWEVLWAFEKVNGTAIDITNEVGIDRRTLNAIDGGIYDPRLGQVVNTDIDIRTYQCKCGKLTGRLYLGDICDECDTECIEQFGQDLLKYGWIDLDPYFIIQPALYEQIKCVIGAKTLERILNYTVNINSEGNILNQSEVKVKVNTPYMNIGVIEFRKRFVEIMNHYLRIKPQKTDRIMLLLKYKSRIFTSKIPIYSSLLRPAYASGKKKMFSYDKINSYYTSIINNVKLLKHSNSKRLKAAGPLIMLYSIQDALQNAYKCTIRSKLSGKSKIIRNTILATRMCFSGRAVITSLVGEHAGMDNIVIGYRMFLELYTLEILNCMMRGIGDPSFKSMTLYELLQHLRFVKYNSIVDETIYSIIEYLLKNHKHGLWVVMNRNPSMDIGSIQVFKIVHVLKDTRKNVIQVPLTSLAELGGDFDGDENNLFCIKELKVAKEFIRGFNPRYLLLDRSGNSTFNSSFSIIKDQITALADFVKIAT